MQKPVLEFRLRAGPVMVYIDIKYLSSGDS